MTTKNTAGTAGDVSPLLQLAVLQAITDRHASMLLQLQSDMAKLLRRLPAGNCGPTSRLVELSGGRKVRK